MFSHTPGPYTANVARLSDGSICVAHVLGPKGQGLAQVGNYGEIETLANLALFVAAPDMCKELDELLLEIDSFLECSSQPSEDWLRDNAGSIRAVLAKARRATP